MPLFLLAVYTKRTKINPASDEKKQLTKLTKQLKIITKVKESRDERPRKRHH